MRAFSCLAFLCFALAAQVAMAQVDSLAPVPGFEYKETIGARRAISGALVVGLTLQSERVPLPPDSFDQIFVYLTDGLKPGEKVRVEIESPDGVYRGTGVFQGRFESGRWARLPLLADSGEPLLIGDFARHGIAINASLTRAGSISEKPSPTVQRLLSSWIEDESGRTHVGFQVNSRRGNVSVSADGRSFRECSKVDSASTLVFDRLCFVELRDLAALPEPKALIIVVRGFGRETVEIDVPLGGLR
jgi:hypothetical protein